MLLTQTLKEWWFDEAPLLAAALAFYTVFSLAPLLVLAVSIVSVAVEGGAVRAELLSQVQYFAGPRAVIVVDDILWQTRDQSQFATFAGLGTLALGATAMFAHLQDSLNRLWGITIKQGQRKRALIRQRLLAFAMIIFVGVLLLAALAMSTAISAATLFLGKYFPFPPVLVQIVNFLASFGLLTVAFALVFKLIPDASVAWKDVWLGAAATSLLFGIGIQLVGAYLAYSSVASLYGAVGSFAVVLIWVYYCSQVFFLGAEFTQVYARRRGSPLQPASYATWITGPH